MRLVLLSALLLTGCQSVGRAPWQTDAQCIRAQMAPPAQWTFDMAARRCVGPTDGQPLTGVGAYYPPLRLRGAPDLQAQARAYGMAYTD